MELEQIKESGLLELYVIGDLNDKDIAIVEDAIARNDELRQELRAIEATLEKIAFMTATSHKFGLKAETLAQVDYIERMDQGEVPNNPPALHPGASIDDYREWLDSPIFQKPANFDDIAAKIIASDDQRTMMILWLDDGAPSEKHTDEIESFLVVEGSCRIIIDGKLHTLSKGDYLSVPLYKKHKLQVTSDAPCKVILEVTQV